MRIEKRLIAGNGVESDQSMLWTGLLREARNKKYQGGNRFLALIADFLERGVELARKDPQALALGSLVGFKIGRGVGGLEGAGAGLAGSIFTIGIIRLLSRPYGEEDNLGKKIATATAAGLVRFLLTSAGAAYAIESLPSIREHFSSPDRVAALSAIIGATAIPEPFSQLGGVPERVGKTLKNVANFPFTALTLAPLVFARIIGKRSLPPEVRKQI